MSLTDIWPPNTATNWTFPAPLDHGFVNNWYLHGPGAHHNGTSTGFQVTDLLIAATANLTAGGHEKFGDEGVVVHVGDVIEPAWKIEEAEDGNLEKRSVLIRCVVCSQGVDGDGEGSGRGIFGACENYTETAHTSTFYNASSPAPPRTSIHLASLSTTLDLPNSSVGLCFLSLGTPEGGSSLDYSVAFPVAQAPRLPCYRFSTEHPTGIVDPTIPYSTGTPIHASPAAGYTGEKQDAGMIVGIVLGVLAGVALLATLCWWAWRRNRTNKSKVVSDDSSAEDVRCVSQRNLELQRVERGGVERRVERDEHGEVPPAYHEVVRSKEGKQGQEPRYV